MEDSQPGVGLRATPLASTKVDHASEAVRQDRQVASDFALRAAIVINHVGDIRRESSRPRPSISCLYTPTSTVKSSVSSASSFR